MAIVAVSVVAGARLLGSADDTVAVWAAADDLAAGDTLTADDLVAHRVRFADDADRARYFSVDDEIPADGLLTRGVGAGELVPRGAIGTSGSVDTMALPVSVDPTLVPPGVTTGWVVDVYLTGDRAPEGPVLRDVVVLEAPALDEVLAVSGRRQVVLGVAEEDATAYFRATGGVTDPVLTIVRRG
jgi:hypothetical protein